MSDIDSLYNGITSKFDTLDENDKAFKVKSILINNSMDEIIVSINTIKKMLKDANTIRSEINNTDDNAKDTLILSFVDKLNAINGRLEKLIANSKKELYNPDKFKKLSAHLKEIIDNPTDNNINDFDIKYFNTILTQTSDEIARQDTREAAEVAALPQSGGRKYKKSLRTSKKVKGGYLYGRSIKRYSKKSQTASKKVKAGYKYRKRNTSKTLSSTRKYKPSKSKRKYFKY